MKTIISICIFAIAVLFSLNGCSEKSQLPDEPLNSLNKVTITDFTLSVYPTGEIDPGTVKIVGQSYIRTNHVVQCTLLTDNEMVTGTLILIKNSRYNVNTGEGVLHGTFSIIPDDYPDARWECTWEGTRSKTGESEWISYLRIVGRSVGGEIDGMKIYSESEITDTDIFGQLGFYGTGTGYIKSRE